MLWSDMLKEIHIRVDSGTGKRLEELAELSGNSVAGLVRGLIQFGLPALEQQIKPPPTKKPDPF